MTISIYSSSFVLEKHGPAFSEYVSLMISNFKNRNKRSFEGHHVYPQTLKEIEKKDKGYFIVYLSKKNHRKAHLLLTKAFPDNYELLFAYRRMVGGKPPHTPLKVNNSHTYKRKEILRNISPENIFELYEYIKIETPWVSFYQFTENYVYQELIESVKTNKTFKRFCL